MAAASPDSHVAQLATAEAALEDFKYFDGLQAINICVEGFCQAFGDDDLKSLRDPITFLSTNSEKMSAEQKAVLGRMYEVRGDLITGLGAHKRAAIDYAAALAVAPHDGLPLKVQSAKEAATGGGKVEKVPVTVITGFLGSGKTTLLNKILKENHGKRIAIIENEFGEVGIDDGLIEAGSMTTEENIVEMSNGCLCCTVRGDLINGLKKIVKNSQKSGKPLDAVMIETTGLADPAPVAQTFFADDFVQQKLALDGILTVVDAKHLVMHLDEDKPEGVENEAVEQVAFADRILLNKCDLVEEKDLDEVERRIRMINAAVKIERCTYSGVDMSFILGIQAFSLDKILEMDDGFLNDDADHQHDDRVSSVGMIIPGEVDQKKLNFWIGGLLQERGIDLFRTKGILAVKGMKEKYVFQAVHMAYAGSSQKPWADGEERICKLTFIGRNLNREELETGFKKCLA